MNVEIIAVGDKLPKWAESAVEEYAQRIKGLFNLNITELAPEKRLKSKPSKTIIDAEGKKIISHIPKNCFVAALEVRGKPYTSETFANELQYLVGTGQNVAFVIGGPDGLSEEILELSNAHWSLSHMTFPHALARLVLVEQIYRAQTILSGHPYHK